MSRILSEKNYNPINVVIGAHIQSLRESLYLTQKDFAKKINLSRTHLVNIEGGLHTVPLKKIYEICDMFNIGIQNILPTSEWYSKNKNMKVIKKISIEIIED